MTFLMMQLSPTLLELLTLSGWIECDGRGATLWFVIDLVVRLLIIGVTVLLACLVLLRAVLRLLGILDITVSTIDWIGVGISACWVAIMLPQLAGWRRTLHQL